MLLEVIEQKLFKHKRCRLYKTNKRHYLMVDCQTGKVQTNFSQARFKDCIQKILGVNISQINSVCNKHRLVTELDIDNIKFTR